MKRTIAKLLLSLACASAPVTASFAQESHTVSVLGLGLLSCESWTQLHKAGAGDVADQWLFGFLSGGAAAARANSLAGIALPDVVNRFWAYCTTNPKSVLAVAATAVGRDLAAQPGKPAQ